jgi:N-acetylneuraminate lyase
MSKYSTAKFRNVTVAFNTPFDPHDCVDLKACRKLARYFYEKGIRQLYLCGSTGEGFLLDHDERKAVVEAVVDEVGDKMNLIVHVGDPAAKYAADLAKHAQCAGADAISSVPCVYYRPGEEGVYRYWTSITEAADLPFFIYNIPQLTGFNLSMNLFNRMLENERVAGIKCSSDPAQDILRFKQAGGKDFIVFNGPDEQYLAGRILGADAGIGGTYGAMPELYLKLEALILHKDFDKALQVQAIITAFIYRLCSFGSLYGAVKAILTKNGVNCGIPRLPFIPVDPDDNALVILWNDINRAILDVENL